MRERVNNELFLERETSSGAILNTDRSGYESLMAIKKRKELGETTMKNEITELRALVMALMATEK